MNLRTEKSIKAWLKLPKDQRDLTADPSTQSIRLHLVDNFDPIALFTIESIVKKRMPRRKKKRVAK